MSIKLPKQWKHWCKLMRLKPESRGRYLCKYEYFALVGHGHRWRVNMHGQFQMSEPYEQFDRWANSVELSMPMPNTEWKFIKAVNTALGKVQDRKTGKWYNPNVKFNELTESHEFIETMKRMADK